MVKNLTEGKPFGLLWKFALPMLGSAAFQQLYNIADSVIAGKFIGDNALAAVGASYPITMIYTAVALGINIGCSVVVSQYFGGKRYSEMKTAVSTSLISSAVLCILLMAAGFLLCSPLMTALSTPENIFDDSLEYLRIYTGGLLFVFLYNICTGTFTALGDSATPFRFLVASSVGNIFMDILMVAGLQMGVAGLAWATFICQGLACVLAFVVLMKRLASIHSDKFPLFSFLMLGKISTLAIPGILQQSFISIGNLLIQRVVNGYGSDVVAGFSASMKLNTFAITLFTTMSNAVSSFSAQNIGAGKPDRVKEGWKCGVKVGMMIVLPFTVVYLFFGKIAMQLFVQAESTAVIEAGVTFLRIVAPFYVLIIMKLISDGVLHGAAAVTLFMCDTFTDLILRVALAFILSDVLKSPVGIWLSWPIGWTISTIMALYFYFSGKWMKQIKENPLY